MNWNTVINHVMHRLGQSVELPKADSKAEAKRYYLDMAVNHKDKEIRQYALRTMHRCFGVQNQPC